MLVMLHSLLAALLVVAAATVFLAMLWAGSRTH
jgi:hypothetical protein